MTVFVTTLKLLVPRPKILAPSPPWNFRGPVCSHAALTLHTNRPFSPAFQKPNSSEAVKKVIKKLSTKGPKENLEVFTSFRTRREFYQTLPTKFTLIED
jgi:hypothetical protein